jgi:hypothetical protein
MLSPVVNHELVRKALEGSATESRDRVQRAELLSGKPKPGQLFGIRRWLRSGFVRSERPVIENGALRSDATASIEAV